MGAGVQGKLFLPGSLTILKKIIEGRNGLAAFVFDELVSTYNYSYSELKKLRDDYKNKKKTL